jgi:hypothetical protein
LCIKEIFVVAGKNSNYNHKSGGTGFLVTAGIIFLALKGLPGLLLGVAIGAGVGAIASIMGKKLDTTTHNRRDREREAQEAILRSQEEARQKQEELRRKQEEASKIPLTGDPQADNVIMKGQEMLITIREENIVITDETLSAQMDTLSDKCMQIFRTVSAEPSKAPQVRKFMSYYLPTSEKLMEQYQVLMNANTKGENIQSAMTTIEKSLGLAADAFDKCADNLYRDDEMDIDAEIKVMQTMLTGDNLIKTEMNSILETSGAAAKAAAEPAEEEPATKDGIRLTLGGH